MTYEEWGRVEFPARTVRKELYADWTADRAAAVDLVRELRGAVEALLIMMDRGPKQRKLDDALSWKENDEKARAVGRVALARTAVFLHGERSSGAEMARRYTAAEVRGAAAWGWDMRFHDASRQMLDVRSSATWPDVPPTEHCWSDARAEAAEAQREAFVAIPFRAILNWWMCSDPWPASEEDHEMIHAWLEAESQARGYKGWVEAYHEEPRVLRPVERGEEGA